MSTGVSQSGFICEEMSMTLRLPALTVTAAILMAMLLGTARAEAASFLGSPDTSASPDAFACAACPPGTSIGLQQFALRGALTESPEDGVLVSAGVYAKRIAGAEQPRIAVLRPADGSGTRVSVVGSAPLPVTSPGGAVHQVDDLHLPVEFGDSVGFLFRTGEVDVGTRTRPRPDGAIQSFTQPCGPCGMDGGTGVELLYDAVVEPDVDEDGLGDETQDPDGGGLGFDWEDDWFEDFEEGDELDDDFEADDSRAARRRLRVLDVDRLRGGGASLLVRVPRRGRLSAAVTLPANRRTGAGPFLTILTGDKGVRRAGRVRLRLASTPGGERVLSRRTRVRTKVVAALIQRNSQLQVRMRSARL
jgi:hypothetical protein